MSFKFYNLKFINSNLEAIQLQILSRLGLQISNIHFKKTETSDAENSKMIENIASIYIRTEKSGCGLNTKDPIILNEWYRFIQNFPIHIGRKLE